MNLFKILSDEFHIGEKYIINLINLISSDATVPFISRYRKEMTGGMEEGIIRNVAERYQYLVELEDRKKTILNSIKEQQRLTPELNSKILNCPEKSRLEDLYLPYKPKRKTRASTAKENGLEPLLIWIISKKNNLDASIEDEAKKYLGRDNGPTTIEDAIQGASDIYAEIIAENAEIREYIRNLFLEQGIFTSKVKRKLKDTKTKFEMYYEYKSPVRNISSHNMLAMNRGEKQDVLSIDIDINEDEILRHIFRKEISAPNNHFINFFNNCIKDAYNRLLKKSIISEVRLKKKKEAELEAINTFEKNLKNLLLLAPAGEVNVVSIDPGFKMGCKITALDKFGNFLEYRAIYPHPPQSKEFEARKIICQFIDTYSPKYIAIGNGTAARETERFIKSIIKDYTKTDRPVVLIVNEAGASVYSISPSAVNEFPELDPLVRGSISIGRRLLDPLAELVKIEPRSIGVGQYQHDVDQNLLKKKLSDVVESCVNYVGVDLNSASLELLSHVSGINSAIAKNIVNSRKERGHFRNRRELLRVSRLGDKAFEQASGFLRIKESDNPLDNSAVHPESYYIVEKIANSIGIPLSELVGNTKLVKKIKPSQFVDSKVGELTLNDILEELSKPGRDPRDSFVYANFNDNINDIKDLKDGMLLEGVVTNVANFGAFIDIGVHTDGLVHISEMAPKFVKDPNDIVKVGQNVKVRVLKIDSELNRITLSLKVKAPNG